MTEDMTPKLLKFLDSEFSKHQSTYPKISFRAKDAVAGSLSIRQHTLRQKKSETIASRGLHIAMGKLLIRIVHDRAGSIGAYRIVIMDSGAARGTRFQATREV